MSLINQMLQDLEDRHADTAQPANYVRPLPSERHTPWSRIATGTIVAGLLVAGIILWLRASEQAQLMAVAVPTPAAVTPISPAAHDKTNVGAPTSALTSKPSKPGLLSADKSDAPAPQPVKGQPLAASPGSSVGIHLKVTNSLSLPGNAVAPVAVKAVSVAAAPAPPAQPASRSVEMPPSIEKQLRLPAASDRAEHEYRKAVTLLNQGRVSDAIAGFRAALQEDASHLNARLTLVGVLVEQKKLEEAQALLQEPLSANPTQPQLALRLARIQVERGDARAAADTLQKAGPASGNAEFHGYYAAVLQRLSRHKDAIEEYKMALRLMAQSGVWWMGLGISLEAEGLASDAREAFQRARATNSLSAELDRFVEQKLKAAE